LADLTAPLFGDDGARKGDVALDPTYFGCEPNHAVLHQVVTAQRAAARAGTHSTKTRSEVRGGGRKPWRQKGLGRARHGSSRSPQWRGGGVAHGPRPRSYAQRTPKKMKQLALRSALSVRAAAGRVAVVDRIGWSTPKTRSAAELLAAVGLQGKFLLVVQPGEGTASRSFRNLAGGMVDAVRALSAHDVLWADTILFTGDALQGLTGAGAFAVTDDDFIPEGGDES